mgnify:CR=1 FL=1
MLATSQAAEPLHVQIDRAVAAGNVTPVAELAGDTEFLRRIYLDLTGCIPTAEKVRTFAKDPDPDKRAKLADELLQSREFARHMALTFDIWLMERRRDAHVKTPEWRAYLTEAFAGNKPYNRLVAEILAADGTDGKNRAASRFYLDRLGEPNQITRDVGRILFGQDLQCAQCHDHPTITDYLQRDYYGLFAFFNRTYLFQPDRKQPAVLAEKAEGAADYKSVFTSAPGEMRPRLLGSVEIEEPSFAPGEEYLVKPDKKDKKLKPVPKYSRRERIAKLATDGNNAAFNRNIVNRLWAHMMGRGMVEPFDFHHAANPPAHPELLDLLAAEFAGMKFDIPAFLAELAKTRTYQRTFELPQTLAEQGRQLEPKLAEFQAEADLQQKAMARAIADLDSAKEAWEFAKIDLEPLRAELKKAEAARNAAVEPMKKAQSEFEPLKPGYEAVQKVIQLLEGVELGSAGVETLAGNLKKRIAEAQAMEKKLRPPYEAKQKAFLTASDKLTKLSATVAEKQKLVDVEQPKVEETKRVMEAALAQYQTAKSASRLASSRLETANELVELAQTAIAAKEARQAADALATQLGQLQATSESAQRLSLNLTESASHAASAHEQLGEDSELGQAVATLQSRSETARSQADAAVARLNSHLAKSKAATAKANELEEQLAVSLDTLTERQTSTFAIGAFAPLSPEQLCMSTLRATGYLDRLISGGNAAFDKKLAAQTAAKDKKPDPKAKKEEKPAKPLAEADRQTEVEAYLDTQLAGSFNKFVALFGGQAGQPQGDFYATADQALFFENDGLVRSWLSPNSTSLTARLIKLETPAEIAEELYLSVLTRFPAKEEVVAVEQYLAGRGEDKTNAVQELAWALLSSTEFRFKH